MKLEDFKGEERNTFIRSLQNEIEEKQWRLEQIKKIENFDKMLKEALDYEDENMSTDIREDSTKEELIEAINDEIESLTNEWKRLEEKISL